MKTAIVYCLHGNEPCGMEVAKRLPSHINTFIGNKKALNNKKRFIDCDLNRIFPGNKFGNHEEKLAHQLVRKLKYFDFVIDIHSSSNSCPLFGIITKPNKKKIKLAKKMRLKKLVIMPECFASGKALIDFVKCGISLEIGPHNRRENVRELEEAICNLTNKRKKIKDIEILKVISVIEKKSLGKILINNFKKVKKGDILIKGKNNQITNFNFIPILVNEKSYKNILCLACIKIKKY